MVESELVCAQMAKKASDILASIRNSVTNKARTMTAPWWVRSHLEVWVPQFRKDMKVYPERDSKVGKGSRE